MFLNKRYIDNALMMTKVIRHEAWHAVHKIAWQEH